MLNPGDAWSESHLLSLTISRLWDCGAGALGCDSIFGARVRTSAWRSSRGLQFGESFDRCERSERLELGHGVSRSMILVLFAGDLFVHVLILPSGPDEFLGF